MNYDISPNREDIIAFLKDYCNYERGPYILVLIARPKENEQLDHNSRILFREIISDSENMRRRLRKFEAIADSYTPQEGGSVNFRLYITVNPRDVMSGFHLFQKEMVDMNGHIISGHKQTKERIKELNREWLSQLQKDTNSAHNMFLFDLDNTSKNRLDELIDNLNNETDIVCSTTTPNGYHVVTYPFNYTEFDMLIDSPDAENQQDSEISIDTDGLLYITSFGS